MQKQTQQVKDLDLLTSSLAAWLSSPTWDWTWVVHQTFDEKKCTLGRGLVLHSWRSLMREIAKDATINYGFCFGERGALGRIHFHALVHMTPSIFGYPVIDEIGPAMYALFGYCRIEPFIGGLNERGHLSIEKMSGGVARYLTKYIAKEAGYHDSTWDFEGLISGRVATGEQLKRAIGMDPGGWSPENGKKGRKRYGRIN